MEPNLELNNMGPVTKKINDTSNFKYSPKKYVFLLSLKKKN